MITPLAIPKPETRKRIDSDYYVEGYATTFNDPYVLWDFGDTQYYEQIDRHAIDNADRSDVIMQYDHMGKVLARISNRTLGLEIDDHGLLIWADLSKSEAARNLYEEIDNGLITKMSWAFTIDEEAFERSTKTRTVLKVKKIYDVSAVSIPADPGTEISARSFAEGRHLAWHRESVARRIRIQMAKNRLTGGN